MPTAASSVPDELMAAKPARCPSRCEPSMPTAPNAMVTMPPPTSQALPNWAEGPASGLNSKVHRRRMTYTPTLVISANSAPTGAVAAL